MQNSDFGDPVSWGPLRHQRSQLALAWIFQNFPRGQANKQSPAKREKSICGGANQFAVGRGLAALVLPSLVLY
jgi:hypothetical protein